MIKLLTLLLFLQTGLSYAIDLPETFDALGPEVKTLDLPDGETIYYIDEGKPDWQPVVFFGGGGTSVRAFGITEYLRTLREELKLRFISIERNGFGQTKFMPGKNYQDYASNVLQVLQHLDIDTTALLAISGGGPYAATTAAKLKNRVSSIHMLAAFSQFDADNAAITPLCELPEAQVQHYAANPVEWWGFETDSPVRNIPGFIDAARDDGARTFSMRGQKMDAAALLAEFKLYCNEKIEPLSSVEAPAYIYYGETDTFVTPPHATFWEKSFPNVSKIRNYANEGHDVQYRHWDQVLVDIAGMSDQTVMCVNDTSILVAEAKAEQFKILGASIGICAWK